MSSLKKGFTYNVLIKEGSINVTIMTVEASSYPLFYKAEEYIDVKVMAVADVVDINEITQYVGVNDMLVAVNGKCFGSVDTQELLLSWKQEFATLGFPRLLTFFRFDESGDLSFEPRTYTYGRCYYHTGFVVGASLDDITELRKWDVCSPDIRVALDKDLAPSNHFTGKYNTSLSDSVAGSYSRLLQTKPRKHTKVEEEAKPPKPVEKPKKSSSILPLIDEKQLLLNELQRFSNVIDQCFVWNVFTQSSRPILNKSVESVRLCIENFASERYTSFQHALTIVKVSINQYEMRVRERMEMETTEAQKEQFIQIIRVLNRLLRILEDIQKAVGNVYSITSGEGSKHQISFLQPVDLPLDTIGDTNEMDFGETYNKDIFHNYVPQKVHIGHLHPDPVVETNALAAVTPPDIFYEFHLPQKIIDDSLLSSLQLETIIYASQRHCLFSPQGYRYGFLLGDGAGVGKGRQLAGIIAENWMKGLHKAIWISESNDLVYDAQRDLRDIGFGDIPVLNLRDSPYGAVTNPKTNTRFTEGVLFLTYSILISRKAGHSLSIHTSRFFQVLNWCGNRDFEGVIILDECHNAKTTTVHLRGSKKGSSSLSKTAQTINDLQKRLPKARIVYSSATGGSDEKEMGYMERLGLWGPGTSYKNYADLSSKLSSGGLSFLEMLCCDMKAKGAFLSRQLSFNGCSFSIHNCKITDDMIAMYKNSVSIWNELYRDFTEALQLVEPYSKYVHIGNPKEKDDLDDLDDENEAPTTDNNSIWKYYYGCFQRFFKHMIMSAKIPECIRVAQEALKENKCVVIGLQSTGDSRTKEMIERMQEDEEEEDDDSGIRIVKQFVSSPREILLQLVENAFPTIVIPEALLIYKKNVDPTPKKHRKRTRVMPVAHEMPSLRTRSNESRQNMERIKAFLLSDDDETSDVMVHDDDQSSEYEFDFVEIIADEEDTPSEEPVKKEEKPPVRRNTKKYLYESLSIAQSRLETMKQELLKKIKSSVFPVNPLDELIDQLGGSTKVAEMTGRTHRILHHHPLVHDSSTDYYYQIWKDNNEGEGEPTNLQLHLDSEYFYYEARGVKRGSEEGANMVEKNAFQNGDKKVAIISEAASAGISLHSDRRVKNQLKRVHIILELPWSADKIIQQCGRSHRSNQSIPPDYVFLLSPIGGELRFLSTLSKRLKALGALTQGSRNATGALDFSGFDYDSSYARNASLLTLGTIMNQETPDDTATAPYDKTPYLPDSYPCDLEMDAEEKSSYEEYENSSGEGRLYLMKSWLETVGFTKEVSEKLNLFFNRIMGLELFKQSLLISYLNDVVEKETYKRQQTEVLDQGLNCITGKRILLARTPEIIYTDPVTGINSYHYTIQVSRSMSYDELMQMGKRGRFYKAGNRNNVVFVYSDDIMPEKWNDRTELHIIRPATGDAANVWLYRDICLRYKEVENGRDLWEAQWKRSQTECSHGPNCKRANCEAGKAIQTVHLITGQFVVLWGFLRDCVPKGKQLRLVQVKLTEDDTVITGVRVQGSGVDNLKRQLQRMQEEQGVEVARQEELTRLYQEKEERKRQKELERRKAEKERRKKRAKEYKERYLLLAQMGREKRIRKTIYGAMVKRPAGMPMLVKLVSFDDVLHAASPYFDISSIKRDESMPGLISLVREDKRIEEEMAAKKSVVLEDSPVDDSCSDSSDSSDSSNSIDSSDNSVSVVSGDNGDNGDKSESGDSQKNNEKLFTDDENSHSAEEDSTVNEASASIKDVFVIE